MKVTSTVAPQQSWEIQVSTYSIYRFTPYRRDGRRQQQSVISAGFCLTVVLQFFEELNMKNYPNNTAFFLPQKVFLTFFLQVFLNETC